jgi:hypothetical protein
LRGVVQVAFAHACRGNELGSFAVAERDREGRSYHDVESRSCWRIISALYFTWPLKIRRIAIIVFQFRVVAGTPYSLSI